MRRPIRAVVSVLVVLLLGGCNGPAEDPVDEDPVDEVSDAVTGDDPVTPDATGTGTGTGASDSASSAPTAADEAGSDEPSAPPPTDGADASEGPSAVEDPLPTSEWTARSDALVPLTEVAAAPFGGQVWVAGGYADNGQSVTDVQVYDPATDSWSTGPSLPQGVNHSALVEAGDRLVLVGGYLGDNTPTDAVRVLDPATGEWADGPPLPEPRGAGAAAWDGQRIVYGGGVGPDGVAGDVWALEDDAWVSLGVLDPPREHLSAASDGEGSVWFLGGRLGGIDQNQTAVDVAGADGVSPLGDLPTARGGVSGFHVAGTGGCSAGGEGPQGTFAEVECMDEFGEVTVLPELLAPRHGIGAVVVEGVAYVLLGGPEPGLTVSPTVQALGLDAVG